MENFIFLAFIIGIFTLMIYIGIDVWKQTKNL